MTKETFGKGNNTIPGKLSSYDYERLVAYLSLVREIGKRDAKLALQLYKELVESVPPPDINSQEGFKQSSYFRSRGSFSRARSTLVRIGLLRRTREGSDNDKKYVHGDSIEVMRNISVGTEKIKEKLSAVFLDPSKLPELLPIPDFQKRGERLKKARTLKGDRLRRRV